MTVNRYGLYLSLIRANLGWNNSRVVLQLVAVWLSSIQSFCQPQRIVINFDILDLFSDQLPPNIICYVSRVLPLCLFFFVHLRWSLAFGTGTHGIASPRHSPPGSLPWGRKSLWGYKGACESASTFQRAANFRSSAIPGKKKIQLS